MVKLPKDPDPSRLGSSCLQKSQPSEKWRVGLVSLLPRIIGSLKFPLKKPGENVSTSTIWQYKISLVSRLQIRVWITTLLFLLLLVSSPLELLVSLPTVNLNQITLFLPDRTPHFEFGRSWFGFFIFSLLKCLELLITLTVHSFLELCISRGLLGGQANANTHTHTQQTHTRAHTHITLTLILQDSECTLASYLQN